MAGLAGKPNPGGAQTVRLAVGDLQVQPVFTSAVSVTPGEAAVSPEEPARADGCASSPPWVWLPDGIALGPDGDAQAPIPNTPTTTNRVHERLSRFDMSNALLIFPISVRSMLRA